MRYLLLILLSSFATMLCICHGQSVVLPDTLFSTQIGELPHDNHHFTPILNEPLFREAPAMTFEDYITAPTHSDDLFYEFPEMPSEFYLHVLVLHLSKVKIPGLDAEMARYNLMLDNFSRNLLQGGNYKVPYVPAIVCDTHSSTFITAGGGATVYSGYLDPLEAYRRWVQERRLMRAKAIISELEANPLPTRNEMKMAPITLPENMLQEENYDVKVKQAGDAPPYRP